MLGCYRYIALALTFLFVGSGVTLQAQPQAPIEWGQSQWANLAGWPGLPQITTLRVIPMGDTLLFTALNVGSEVSDTILVCSSFDNGQTINTWRRVTQGQESAAAYFAGSDGKYYCFVNRIEPQPLACWVVRSDDGGLTWNPPQEYRENTLYMGGNASGGEVIVKYISLINNNLSTRIIRSVSHGENWFAPVIVDTADFALPSLNQSIAFTRTHRLIIEQPAPSELDFRFFVATGDSAGQEWTTFQVLPCEYYEQWAAQTVATIIGDTSSEAASVLGLFRDSFAPARPFHYRSDDVGLGWESCVPMTDELHVIPDFLSLPLNIGHGKIWIVGWEHIDPNGQGWNSLRVRLSANQGKNWYEMATAADSVADLWFLNGQIRENRVDIYWDQMTWRQDMRDYRMVSGTITPDTTLPDLFTVIAPQETVQVGQELSISVHADDNDTLSEVRLTIQNLDGQTWHFLMPSLDGEIYDTQWTVPDSGYYTYWFEAEDWWENVARLPDSATFHFATEGWTRLDDFRRIPLSFDISIFPNPSNGWLNFSLSADWYQYGPVTVTLYNTLGRKVAEKVINTASERTSPGSLDASGVYILRVSNGLRSTNKKFVVLK